MTAADAQVPDAPQRRDLREEGRRIIAAASDVSVPVRLMGGVAVALRCPAASVAPLAREYKDIDLVARAADQAALTAMMIDIGYRADEEFNALHGRARLLFFDPLGRQVDVILDQLEMCHTLDLRDRLLLDPETLTIPDLLLSKLQVVEVNQRDLQDSAALLHDHEPGAERICEVLAGDWGWWRTVTENLDKVTAWSQGAAEFEQGAAPVADRVEGLRRQIEAAPKGLRWKARAKVGERARWYELPEEVDG